MALSSVFVHGCQVSFNCMWKLLQADPGQPDMYVMVLKDVYLAYQACVSVCIVCCWMRKLSRETKHTGLLTSDREP